MYIHNTFLRHLAHIIGLFVFGVALVWFITMLITSVCAFIQMDYSLYYKVLPYLDPRNFLWMRVLTLIWIGISIFFGRILGELG